MLGTTCFDRFIKGIFPTDRKLVSIHSAPAPILGRDRDLPKVSTILLHKASSLGAHEHATIRVPKHVAIPAERKSPVVLKSSRNVLMTIERIQSDKTNRVPHAYGICQYEKMYYFEH